MQVTLDKKIAMLSYVEVKPFRDSQDSQIGYEYNYSTLLPEIQKRWKFKENDIGKDGKFWTNEEDHLLLSVIRHKTHIWPCLQHMLGIHKEVDNHK
jgi:hypothetical protein